LLCRRPIRRVVVAPALHAAVRRQGTRVAIPPAKPSAPRPTRRSSAHDRRRRRATGSRTVAYWPNQLLPQHCTAPPSSRRTCAGTRRHGRTPLVSPDTSVGVVRLRRVRRPVGRRIAAPSTSPAPVVTAQVLSSAVTAPRRWSVPQRRRRQASVVVASPSWPNRCSPSTHATQSPPRRCAGAGGHAAMPLVGPTTSTGVVRLVVVPSPTCVVVAAQHFHPRRRHAQV